MWVGAEVFWLFWWGPGGVEEAEEERARGGFDEGEGGGEAERVVCEGDGFEVGAKLAGAGEPEAEEGAGGSGEDEPEEGVPRNEDDSEEGEREG